MASKINFVIRLQHWMDSVPGQTFLNYAYSWGASIVILGALFKLTHLPGGNVMLFIGMGTEVVVFFLSAFDRPFDKNEIGKELPKDYETDEEIAARLGLVDEEAVEDEEDDAVTATKPKAADKGSQVESVRLQLETPAAQAGSAAPAGVVIIGGGSSSVPSPAPVSNDDSLKPATSDVQVQEPAKPLSSVEAARAAMVAATPEGGEPFEQEARRLAEIIRIANDELLERAQAVLSPEMEEASKEYIEKLRVLTETFTKIDEQSSRLTRDSEEMNNLGRTLTAINKTYDLHFKSISQQVGTIEQINEQTRCLARRIEELNGVYSRMIEAMTVNIPGAAKQ